MSCMKKEINKKSIMDPHVLTPLPDNKILGLPKLKASVDEKSNVTQNIKGVFHRIENIVGKEENAGYQKPFPSRASKVVIVW